MGPANKHWPNLFKSKPCNADYHRWQHDINPYRQNTSGTCEERSPEPKSRWNPKPEQIRILEAMFNSGVVNPPRDEIRKIRTQLQEYGQVGDANVFYWFQNRKSRSKHKQRQLQSSRNQLRSANTVARAPGTPGTAGTAASSSSSEQSSGSDRNHPSVASISVTVGLTSAKPAPPPLPMYFHSSIDVSGESFLFQNPGSLCISTADLIGIVRAPHIGLSSPILWDGVMEHNQGCKNGEDEAKIKSVQLQNEGYAIDASAAVSAAPVTRVAASLGVTATVGAPANATVASCIHMMKELDGGNNDGRVPVKSTVFINEVAFEVPAGAFNAREAFGDDAVLIHSSGQPVITNDWGVTVHPLQHGASYYLV